MPGKVIIPPPPPIPAEASPIGVVDELPKSGSIFARAWAMSRWIGQILQPLIVAGLLAGIAVAIDTCDSVRTLEAQGRAHEAALGRVDQQQQRADERQEKAEARLERVVAEMSTLNARLAKLLGMLEGRRE